MAFREKSAWISLLATLVVYTVYFYYFGRSLAEGQAFGIGGPIILSIVALVVIQVVLHIVAAIASPSEARAPEDERDQEIRRRANTGGFIMMQCGMALVAASAYFVDKWFMANLAVGVLAVAQAGFYGAVIFGYRRGV